jgi:O-antigen ligase
MQDTAEGRIIGGVATFRVIESSPIFGVGYENHELYDEQYRGRVLDLAVNGTHTSHNTYLLLIAEMGITGFLFYMFPFAWWWLASRKARFKMPDYGFLSWRMLAIFWLMLFDHIAVGSFTDMIQSNLFGTSMWWLIMGLIASLASRHLAPAAEQVRARVKPGQPAKSQPSEVL